MVLDTSAVLAILFDEPEAEVIEAAIERAPVRLMAAPSVLEAAIVAETRYGEPGGRELDLLLHKAKVDVVPFDSDLAELARRAWRRYGKGRHPAALDFGDCFSYALSRASGESLLFTGGDFSRTDVVAAMSPDEE